MSDNTCHGAGATHDEHAGGGAGRTGRRSIGRRRFLSFLGGGGLAAAGALFGETASAEAASCGCCNPVYCPANTSISSCRSVSHYIWSCSMSAFLYCSCCEKKRSTGGYYASAYSCQY